MSTLGKVLLALYAATGSICLTGPFGPYVVFNVYVISAAFMMYAFTRKA